MAEEKTKAEKTMIDVLRENEGKKFRLDDRKKVEMTSDYKSLKKGVIIKPHRLKADLLIELKVAKEVK